MEAIFCYPRSSKRSWVDFLSFPVRFSVAVCFVKEIVKRIILIVRLVQQENIVFSPDLANVGFQIKSFLKAISGLIFFSEKRSVLRSSLFISPSKSHLVSVKKCSNKPAIRG